MSRSGEIWQADLEKVCEDYVAGETERAEALSGLQGLGLGIDEATDLLNDMDYDRFGGPELSKENLDRLKNGKSILVSSNPERLDG